MPSSAVSPATIVAPECHPLADGPTESQIAFNDSPFYWLKYRLGVESFDCTGGYDQSTITAFYKVSEETSMLALYTKLLIFTILVSFGIVLLFCIPLNPVDHSFDVNLSFLVFFSSLSGYTSI